MVLNGQARKMQGRGFHQGFRKVCSAQAMDDRKEEWTAITRSGGSEAQDALENQRGWMPGPGDTY